MATSKQQSLATISAATRALAEATTPEQTQAVAAMSEAAMAWAKASGDYGLLIEAKRVHVRARFKTVELVHLVMPKQGRKKGTKVVGKEVVDNFFTSAADVLAQVNITEEEWHDLLGEWRTLKGADGHLREDLLDAYLGKQAEEGEDPTTAGLLAYIKDLLNPKKPKPPKKHADTPLDEATFLIKDLTEVLHQVGTITDASQVKGRLATARKIRQLFTAVVKGLDKLIAQLEAFKEGDK